MSLIHILTVVCRFLNFFGLIYPELRRKKEAGPHANDDKLEASFKKTSLTNA